MKKEMGSRNFLFCMIFILGIICALNLVCADIHVITPVNDTDSRSSVSILITFTNATDITDPTSAKSNCSLNGTGADVPFTLTAFTVNSTAVTAEASASVLVDGLGQKISCTLGNATTTAMITSVGNTTNHDFYTDNVSCAFDTDRDSIKILDVFGIETIDSSTKDSLTSLTYAWTLYDPSINTEETSTSQEPTFSDEDFDELDGYTLQLIITDTFSNIGVCTNKTIHVKGRDDGTTDIIVADQAKDEKNIMVTLFLIIGIVVVLLLAIGGYLGYAKSKKG